ncbi:hypothetical protein EDD22DRAFT_373855 [Suillus occidentalis]|nr:hypothetical protein EDD22DRAFT_373855 [Suillus occidentalis]
MHRAFDSDDIVYSILEHLKFPLRNLRNVAMTCSRLAGPALNILWSEQSSLLPLIMCLPQGPWASRMRLLIFPESRLPVSGSAS